jgi:hypothetical protein
MLEIITPAASHDLTVLDTARAELGGAPGVTDPEILALIGQASAACARACNRPTFARERVRQTEHYRGPEPIVLARDLNTAVVSVTDNGTALDSTGYLLTDGVLWRQSAGWRGAWCYGATVIEYDSGFELLAGLPEDIERACLLVLRAWFFSRGRDPTIRSMSSEGIGMTQFAAPAAAGLPPEAAQLLAPWRRLPGF